MREYLFRGKSIVADNPSTPRYWIEGYLINTENACHIVTKENVYLELDCNSEVWPETVGQFTGMYDKNGRRIFEGDIVEAMMDFGPAGFYKQVVSVGWVDGRGYQWEYFDTSTIEVIGNIYDDYERYFV